MELKTMVDPITASVAVSLLSPFLIKAGEKFAEKVGEKLADKTGQIYNLLKESFVGDEYARLTLLRLEHAPENEGRKSALETVIKEKMEEDNEFAKQLDKLIDEAKQADTNNVIASGNRSVAIGGNVHSSNIITGDDNKVVKE
jgi:hypothetical protein